jgi:hypothetical protein
MYRTQRNEGEQGSGGKVLDILNHETRGRYETDSCSSSFIPGERASITLIVRKLVSYIIS